MKSFGIIQEAGDIFKTINSMLFMRDNYVLVGIPQKETTREGEEITNAELLFIHTNGSPVNNIPARPVIEPAIKYNKDRISEMLRKSAQAFIDGSRIKAYEQLERVGIYAQNICRGWFTNPNNGWPPNSPSVIKVKMKKGATEPRPLIDTGELRKSITYVIVKDGEEQ